MPKIKFEVRLNGEIKTVVATVYDHLFDMRGKWFCATDGKHYWRVRQQNAEYVN